MRVVLFLTSAVLAAACASPANATKPATALASTPIEPVQEPEPVPAPGPTKATRPLEIKNDCNVAVTVSYGVQPSASSPHAAIPAESSANATRDPDGTLTVWIVDEKDAGIASVQVSRRMRKVEIGKSCRTLYAH